MEGYPPCKQLISHFCSFLFQFVVFCAVSLPPPPKKKKKKMEVLPANRGSNFYAGSLSLVKVGKCKHTGLSSSGAQIQADTTKTDADTDTKYSYRYTVRDKKLRTEEDRKCI